MRLFTLFALFLFLFESCAFDGDADNLVLQEIVVGNFKLEQQAKSDEIQLVFQSTPEFSADVISDCKTLGYDSVNKTILVAEYVTPNDNSYYKINIIDANSKDMINACNKTEISELEYVTYLKRCKTCNVRNFSKKWK